MPCSANLLGIRYQDPIDLRREAEAIYSAFELSLCRDVVFEVCVYVYYTHISGVSDSAWVFADMLIFVLHIGELLLEESLLPEYRGVYSTTDPQFESSTTDPHFGVHVCLEFVCIVFVPFLPLASSVLGLISSSYPLPPLSRSLLFAATPRAPHRGTHQRAAVGGAPKPTAEVSPRRRRLRTHPAQRAFHQHHLSQL